MRWLKTCIWCIHVLCFILLYIDWLCKNVNTHAQYMIVLVWWLTLYWLAGESFACFMTQVVLLFWSVSGLRWLRVDVTAWSRLFADEGGMRDCVLVIICCSVVVVSAFLTPAEWEVARAQRTYTANFEFSIIQAVRDSSNCQAARDFSERQVAQDRSASWRQSFRRLKSLTRPKKFGHSTVSD